MNPLAKLLVGGGAVATCAGGGAGIYFGTKGGSQTSHQGTQISDSGRRDSGKSRETSEESKWILGTNSEKKKSLRVVFKPKGLPTNLKDVKFGEGFDVVVGNYTLQAKDLLCNLDGNKGQFFVIKYTGTEKNNYQTVDGKEIKGCEGVAPEKVVKYAVTSWGNNKPLSEIKIAIETCYFSGQEKQDNLQKQIQLICKDMVQTSITEVPRPYILIEVKESN